MANQELSAKSNFFWKLILALGYVGLLALNISILVVVVPGPWLGKVALLLAVLGVYTFALGFLTQTEILKQFGALTEDMTSPNLYEFIGSNFHFMSILSSSLAQAMYPEKTTPVGWRSLFWLIFDVPVLFLTALIFLAYSVFHLVVITPIAYIAYVIVSVPIRNIQTSRRDTEVTFSSPSLGKQTVSIQEIFSSNVVSVRSFLVAVPAMVFSMILLTASVLGWTL